MNNAAIVGLSEYIKQCKDRLTRLVQEFDARKTKYSVQTEANLIKQKCMIQETADTNIKDQLEFSIENEMVEQLLRKPVRGKFYRDLGRPSMDREKSLVCLCSSSLKGETESLVIAAQDQAHNMRYHPRNIMKRPIGSTCKMCCEAECKHTTYCCGMHTLVPSVYTNRHKKAAGCIHWLIHKHMGLQFTDKYCEHIPERVVNVSGTTVMWDVPVNVNGTTVMWDVPVNVNGTTYVGCTSKCQWYHCYVGCTSKCQWYHLCGMYQ
jgi:hypothetical protein